MRVVVSLLVLLVAAPAWAHDGAHPPPGGPSAWDAAALAALGVSGALYALGTLRLARRGARVRAVERASFWAGWAAIVAAVAPPIDRAASLAFSMHMAQHELLMLVGAPLMIVGRPVLAWMWALPDRVRRAAGSGLQAHAVGAGWRLATTPVVAWALHGAAIWVWHVPAFYEAAVVSEPVHALQHLTFVATAVFFWWGLVYGRYGRAAYGASVLWVFTTMVHTGLLGALFALSTSPYYDVYRARAALAGLDPTVDQQLAGLVMWIPAGLVLTVFGLALLVAWLSEAERRAWAGRDGPDVRVGGSR
jgi:putative membrane protein